MSQAFTGSGYIQIMVGNEISRFLQAYRRRPHAAG